MHDSQHPEYRPPYDPQGWHLDKRVQISHILATLTCAAALAAYMGNIKSDVEVLKSQAAEAKVRADRQDSTTKEAVAQVSQRLDRIDTKLDRLMDRDPRPPRR